MKSLILKSTMFLGAAVLMGLGAQAQSLEANIPFEFHANGRSMPSGTYIISPASNNGRGIYTMRSGSAHEGVILNSVSTIRQKENGPTKLVFDRGLDGYYLTEMWDGESGRRLASPRGKDAFVASARVVIMAK